MLHVFSLYAVICVFTPTYHRLRMYVRMAIVIMNVGSI